MGIEWVIYIYMICVQMEVHMGEHMYIFVIYAQIIYIYIHF